MVIGYARVSTEQQGTEAQLPKLRKAGCKRIYKEKMGGGTMERPELEKCLERLENGDTLVVWRLGRSIRDLLEIVDRLDKSGINFISLRERTTPAPPQADWPSTSLLHSRSLRRN